jgi:hypothetical protein
VPADFGGKAGLGVSLRMGQSNQKPIAHARWRRYQLDSNALDSDFLFQPRRQPTAAESLSGTRTDADNYQTRLKTHSVVCTILYTHYHRKPLYFQGGLHILTVDLPIR